MQVNSVVRFSSEDKKEIKLKDGRLWKFSMLYFFKAGEGELIFRVNTEKDSPNFPFSSLKADEKYEIFYDLFPAGDKKDPLAWSSLLTRFIKVK